ncbi:hypothetical protein DITRI_Ditri05aG0090400 [Diplodiscus trichospermus]
MGADEKPKPTLQPCIAKHALQDSRSPPQPVSASSNNATAMVEEPKKEGSILDSENNDSVDYLDSFPPGFRFCPLDEELILHYLKKKVMNETLPQNRITEVNLYRHNPEKLAEQFKQYGEKEWYFFTPRDKKYRNGTRPNRAAGDGYWKATGADKEVKCNGQVVGYRKALVFYRGKPPKGDKTNWIMHEYRVNDPPPCKRIYNDMRLDDWVLCRIYKKVDKSVRTQHKDEDSSPSIHNEDTNDLMSLDFDYNSVVDSMDCSNNIGCFMNDESFTNFQHTIGDQFPTSLSFNYETHPKIDLHPFKSLSRGVQDEIWNVANLDFASQLDFYGVACVEQLNNLDNSLSGDTPNKSDSANSKMNGK